MLLIKLIHVAVLHAYCSGKNVSLSCFYTMCTLLVRMFVGLSYFCTICILF